MNSGKSKRIKNQVLKNIDLTNSFQKKTLSFTENVAFVAPLTTGCGFASEMGLRN